MAWMQDLAALVARGEPGLRDLTRLVSYLLLVNEKLSTEALSEFLSPLGDKARRIPMTEVERLIEEGMQRGMQKGVRKGILQGQLRATQALARKALPMGMSPAEVVELTGLSLDEVRALTH